MAQKIVIIGNGIAGITTARFLRKYGNDQIAVISAESDHFYARTALMYLYMGHMNMEQTKPYEDWFWEKNRIALLRAYVERFDSHARNVYLNTGQVLPYDHLVLATGSQTNRFGWPGENLPGVQGLYGLEDLALMERQTKGIQRGVVVGGGLIGVEMAEMLTARHIPVTFLVREESYMDYLLPPEESQMVNHEIRLHHVDLRLGTALDSVLPDEQGNVRAVLTGNGEEIPCQFVGLTAGVHPNITLAKGTPVETNRGYLVNPFFETSVPNVYAAGDCAEFREAKPGQRSIEQLWYTGRAQGKALAGILSGKRVPYKPDIFFNSAKFFDLEYQTYGTIESSPQEGVGSLFWMHERGDKSIRINYRVDDESVIGFNLMGVRYRHEVCSQWIKEGTPLRVVLENLGAANFDPEFFRQFEAQVVTAFNASQTGTPVRLRRKRGLFARS